MAIYGAFTHCRIYLGGCDLTGDANMVKLTATKEVKERTVFGNVGKGRSVQGLGDISMSAAGFANFAVAAQNAQFLANWGTNTICTSVMIPLVSKTAVAVGDNAYFFKGVQPQYVTGEAQGNDLLWSLNMQGGSTGYPLLFGKVLDPGAIGITADGNGTGVLYSAVGATQYAYALMHLTEISVTTPGDSMAVIIQSDDNSGFTSPTTRFTFSAASTIGSEFLARLAGPITDTYWRAVYNSPVDPSSFKCAISLAIQ
jgi:hypothetical protein